MPDLEVYSFQHKNSTIVPIPLLGKLVIYHHLILDTSLEYLLYKVRHRLQVGLDLPHRLPYAVIVYDVLVYSVYLYEDPMVPIHVDRDYYVVLT